MKHLSQPQLERGLHTKPGTVQCVFLPADADELLVSFKVLYFKNLRGNDNPQLKEQIIAVTDKL